MDKTTTPFELSLAQSELWLAQLIHPTVPICVAHYTDLHGPLDRELLQRCGRRAGREMQSPHVRFAMIEGRPHQYLDEGEARFEYVDLTESDCPDDAARLWMANDSQVDVDLLGDNVSTTVLFKLGPELHRLYGRSHHIAIDGYGAAQVLDRVAELYSAAVAGQEASTCRAMTLAEIVGAERDYRSSARFDADREFWRAQLADMDHATRLIDRYATATARPHVVSAKLEPIPMARLNAVAAQHGAGVAELMVAAVIAFLARMTGDDDVTVSLPVAGRTTAALRRSAGMVSNVVPLRVRGMAGHTISTLVQDVRLAMIGALRHQLYRHEDLRRDHGLGLTGRSGYGPVVNVLTFSETIALGPVRGKPHLLSVGPVEDLAINCYRFGNAPLTIDFHANPELYSTDDLDRYHRHFTQFLDQFLCAPADESVLAILGDRRVIPLAQRQTPRLLPELLSTGMGPGERPALTGESRSLTYGELDCVSSRWAQELISVGAGPEIVVAVALTRSIESVVALWAVAKVGAVFFPVDPSGPPARVAKLITDSRAALGITSTSWRPQLPDAPIRWVMLDGERLAPAASSPVTGAERIRPVRADNPAYLIYTSGSSGEPKGVLTTHQGLAALADDLVTRYRAGEDSVVLQSHSPYCDASMLEYFTAFAAGAELIVPPPDVVAGEALAQLIKRHSVTHLLVTPAILATLDPRALPSLRTVAVGGEKCPPALAARWAGRVAMFNSYGPTESTVVVTQTDVLDPVPDITIGRALPGVQSMVLDRRLRPTPHGASGELYLGGDELARGYLGQAGTTSGYFVANPYGSNGSRMYRTGDVVRERPDATLEFIGRADVQISLRGQRIEPGEVERALTADETVDHAAVRIWHSAQLGDRLIGYVVPAATSEFDRNAVLARLRAVLPSAMVPATLVPITAIPVNESSGKVDREALPDPQLLPRPAFRPPGSPVEHAVVNAIAAVTGQSQIGLDDNFFELGGNSLLGVELCNRLSADTGAAVAVSWLFTPTVQTLAGRIETALTANSANSPVTEDDSALRTVLPLRESGANAPLICLHSAVPLSWCYAGLVHYVTDRPIYGLQSPTIAAEPRRFHTIEELAEIYLHELTRVQPTGPYNLLGWSLGGQLAHALAVRLRARGDEVGLLVMLDSVAFAEGTTQPELPTLRDLVTHLQGNEAEEADTSPLNLDEAVELLEHSTGPGRGLTGEQLERLHQGYLDCVQMSAHYRPAQYDGDLHYFSATRGITGELTGQQWRPYVSGRITEHPIDAVHAQMTNPNILALIGPIVDTELKRLQQSECRG
ncbi:UNVERIFIED_CONTAM: enterobactin synthetase component F [Williamsia faeni]